MLLSAIVEKLDLRPVVSASVDPDINSGYSSDLLSDVLANAKDGHIWVTNQKHQNCVAVASLLGLSALVIAGGVVPDENTVERAASEGVALYTTDMSVFEVVGKLYELGVKGT